MSFEAAARIATALLYEGYALYPYRASALKNQRRWAFGSLYPPGFSDEPNDRASATFGCLVRGSDPIVRIEARFLHGVERRDDGAAPWHEAIERTAAIEPVRASDFVVSTRRVAFVFPSEMMLDGSIERTSYALRGALSVSATALGESVFELRVSIENETDFAGEDRDAAHLRALGAAHVILGCDGGRFVSRADPDADLVACSELLASEGLWPALIGRDGAAMLASPIILEDQASVAPESPGDLFDATEMDEMLALRIRTLADHERAEAVAGDERVRALIERTESLDPAAIARLHGAFRDAFRAGDKVRLRPRAQGDTFDLALAGEHATVVRVDHDFEGRAHYAVTVDADPGRDLGEAGFPGHRFYFSADELERST